MLCILRIVFELLRVSFRSCKILSYSIGIYRYINYLEIFFFVILKLGIIIYVYEKKKFLMNIIENVIVDDWMILEYFGLYIVFNEVDNEILIIN